MKKITRIILTLALVGLGLAGCSKKPQPPADNVQVNGVSVDMPKLQRIFSTETNADIQKVMFDLDQGFRYHDYPKAVAAAEELAAKPDLNDDEKKVATDVLEQLKKVAGVGGAPSQ